MGQWQSSTTVPLDAARLNDYLDLTPFNEQQIRKYAGAA